MRKVASGKLKHYVFKNVEWYVDRQRSARKALVLAPMPDHRSSEHQAVINKQKMVNSLGLSVSSLLRGLCDLLYRL